MPFELDLLGHVDFYGFGLSAVDPTADMLVSRPFGGTAVLYDKKTTQFIKIVESEYRQIIVFILFTYIGPILFFNVYMPTDYGDFNCFNDYADVCAKLSALYTDHDVAFLVVAGDFNCNVRSRFYDMFVQLCNGNRLVCSDYAQLQNVFTYSSDNGLRYSWIDRVICSVPVDDYINSIKIETGFICSDHKLISVMFNKLISRPSSQSYMNSHGNHGSHCSSY